MRCTSHIPKRDVAVLVLCTLLLVSSFAAVGIRGRERAKRAVCLANLRQLTSAWLIYAGENDGKIVNGAGGFHYCEPGYMMTYNGSASNIVERAWVGQAWGRNWNNRNVADTGFTAEDQSRSIREGALWPLVGEEHIYQCPLARDHEFVNYAIVDAMNGLYRSGTAISMAGGHPHAVGSRVDRTVLWVKNLDEIDVPGPAERMVFIDEGAVTPDSFGVHYQQSQWWDDPPVRHNDGATVSWADGHAGYLQWKGTDTIERGRMTTEFYGGGGFVPQTAEGIEDLDEFRRAVWGRIPGQP